MTKNNLMNASRRTALKVAGASAALVAGGVSAAEAATRSARRWTARWRGEFCADAGSDALQRVVHPPGVKGC